MLLREILQTLLAKINGAQDGGIFRLEPVQNPMQAGADLIVNFRGCLSRSLQLASPGLKSFIRGGPSAVSIDDRVAKQAIEPSHGRFARRKVVLVLKSPKVRGLKNIFGELHVGDTPLHESEELLTLR